MSHFPSKTGCARPKFAVKNDRAADSFANSYVEEVAAAATGADFVLTISGGVGIVFEFDTSSPVASMNSE